MARKPREFVAGGIYHVYARGNARRTIYVDDLDHRIYLRMLRDVVHAREWRLLAFCLMPNHVHLVLETPRPDLGAGMQRLHGDYARSFNARHESVGHVFQGRYGAVRILDDPHFMTVVAYVAANPVNAGLCPRATDWRWSSHGSVIAGTCPAWLDRAHLLALLGGADRGLQRYRGLVADREARWGSDPDGRGQTP